MLEERILRLCESVSAHPDYDSRWAALAFTHFQQGFMALTRGILNPPRIPLPGDEKRDEQMEMELERAGQAEDEGAPATDSP